MAKMSLHTILSFLTAVSINAELYEVASWNFLTFRPPAGYPGAASYGQAIFAPNAVFTGLESHGNRLYLSMPRYMAGQPTTLGWVPKPTTGSRLRLNTVINPFPSWDWHKAAAAGSATTNCSALVSVYRTRVDQCGRLWVLDTGVMHTPTATSTSCLPKLVVFNTTSAQLLRRIEFRGELLRVNSLLTNMVFDFRSGATCDDFFIYISDSSAPGLIVYDVRKDAAWRFSTPQMWPDPQKGVFKVADESFELMDGITGLALSNTFAGSSYRPETGYTDRTLYFQPLSSDRIYSVPASCLLAGPNTALPVTLVGYKPSQGAPLAVDPANNTLVFSSVSETWVISWDPSQNLSTLHGYNIHQLQFVLDLLVDQQEIWLISTRFQKFYLRTVTGSEVNLRIMRIDRS